MGPVLKFLKALVKAALIVALLWTAVTFMTIRIASVGRERARTVYVIMKLKRIAEALKEYRQEQGTLPFSSGGETDRRWTVTLYPFFHEKDADKKCPSGDTLPKTDNGTSDGLMAETPEIYNIYSLLSQIINQ